MPYVSDRFDIPAALDGDAVAAGAAAMRALADRLDLLLGETGTVDLAGGGTSSWVSVRVNYARDYSDTTLPMPRAWVITTSHHFDHLFQVDGEDRTGFTLNMRSNSTAVRTVRWWARPA